MVCGKISTGDPTRQYVGSGQMSGRRVGSGRVGSGRVGLRFSDPSAPLFIYERKV